MNGDDRKDEADVRDGIDLESSGRELARRLPSPGVGAPDLDRYRCHVEHFDLSDTQKTDLLLAVWQIMRNFVDRAFGDDPVQQVIKGRKRLSDDAAQWSAHRLHTNADSHDDEADLSHVFENRAAGTDER